MSTLQFVDRYIDVALDVDARHPSLFINLNICCFYRLPQTQHVFVTHSNIVHFGPISELRDLVLAE
jgi:hypothetical protein